MLLPIYSLAFIIGMQSVSAQKISTITGKVLNKADSTALPYASISLMNSRIGTVSNMSGEFKLNFPASCLNDTLAVSFIGFSHFSVALKDIDSETGFLVWLEPKTYLLKEAVVKPRIYNARKIVRKAVRRINRNYAENYLAKGFYREYVKEDGEYVRAMECAVSIYDGGYEPVPMPLKMFVQERVRIDEIRRSEDYHKDEKSFIMINNLRQLLVLNYLRYRRGIFNKFPINNNSYTLDSITYYNGNLVYAISVSEMKLYIRTDNLAFVKVRSKVDMNINNKNKMEIKHKSGNLYYTLGIYENTAFYEEHNGKMYPKYNSLYYQTKSYKTSTADEGVLTEIYSDLMFNDIESGSVKYIPKEERMDQYKDIYKQGYTYNPEFWEHYNIITVSPLSKQVYGDLEKKRKKPR